MPIYEFSCTACGVVFEELVRNGDQAALPVVRHARRATACSRGSPSIPRRRTWAAVAPPRAARPARVPPVPPATDPDDVAAAARRPPRGRSQHCTRCRLHETRTQTVFGEGDPLSQLMFVGEAPGYHEDQQGRPFVGAAGKLLGELLASIGLRREQVFIANVLKIRPPNNRDPQPDEIAACEPWLWQQIAIIRPSVICTLGNFATKLLSGDADGHHARARPPAAARARRPARVSVSDLPSRGGALHAGHAGDAQAGFPAPARAAGRAAGRLARRRGRDGRRKSRRRPGTRPACAHAGPTMPIRRLARRCRRPGDSATGGATAPQTRLPREHAASAAGRAARALLNAARRPLFAGPDARARPGAWLPCCGRRPSSRCAVSSAPARRRWCARRCARSASREVVASPSFTLAQSYHTPRGRDGAPSRSVPAGGRRRRRALRLGRLPRRRA